MRLDAQRIGALLVDQAEVVLERLLGEPKTKTGGQYRYGSNQGSLIITLTGDKRGLWHDFQTGQGGHLLNLVAVQKNLDVQRDFHRVLQEALKLIGTSEADISVQATPSAMPDKSLKTLKTASLALTSEQQRSLRYARQLARESQPIANTLAERYLREHRGIALENFPDTVRFHPGIYSRRNEASHPALLVVAKNSNHQVQAVQAIFLDKDTAQKADVLVKKQTWGRPSQGSVSLMTASTFPGVTYLAEGPETALSVYAALNGADVRITLGKSNFKNIDPKTTSAHIVLCLDNDGQNPHSDQLIHLAAKKLQEKNKQVWIAQPKSEGQDYNDVLMQQGRKSVRVAMEQAVSYTDYCQPTSTASLSSLGKDALALVAQNSKVGREVQENQIQVEGHLLKESYALAASEKINQKIYLAERQSSKELGENSLPMSSDPANSPFPRRPIEKEPEI